MPKKRQAVEVESLQVGIKTVVAIIMVVAMAVAGAFYWKDYIMDQSEDIEIQATTIEELNTRINSISRKVNKLRLLNRKVSELIITSQSNTAYMVDLTNKILINATDIKNNKEVLATKSNKLF